MTKKKGAKPHKESSESGNNRENDDDENENEDYSDVEQERADEYKKGGYHPVHIGDVFKERYVVVKKLGWGYFSTVWLCYDKSFATKEKTTAGETTTFNNNNNNATNAAKTSNSSESSSENSSSSSSFYFPFVAIKVQKSAPQYREAAYDEISLLNQITSGDKNDTKCTVHLLDHFIHQGPNGKRLQFFFFFCFPPFCLCFQDSLSSASSRCLHGV